MVRICLLLTKKVALLLGRVDPRRYNQTSMENNPNEPDQSNLEDLISLKEAAESSGLSHDHLRRLAGRGDLWAKKIGRDWVTTHIAVRDYLARDRRPGPK